MPEYDESSLKKDHFEKLKNPGEKLLDDEDDESFFEIAIVNRKNQAIVTDCKVRMGDIMFDRFFVVDKDAD
jgi:hypothetical protein